MYCFAIVLLSVGHVFANPQDPLVSAGDVVFTNNANKLTIMQTSPQAIINWQSFNISKNEKTQFIQPANGVVLNRINADQGASQILGSLSANGTVILVNSAGIFFGRDSEVNVNSIIASTLDITDQNFIDNKLNFSIAGKHQAGITNKGKIVAADYGLVALIGNSVSNDGLIHCKLGKVALACGSEITIDLNGDDLIVFGKSNAHNSQLNNLGSVYAEGGEIVLSANVVEEVLDNSINMQGLLQADTMIENNGKIIIYGGQNGSLNIDGIINARGNNHNEVGGSIRITAGNKVHVNNNTKIDASGVLDGGEILIGGYYQGANKEFINAKKFYTENRFKAGLPLEEPNRHFYKNKYANSKSTYIEDQVIIKADSKLGNAGSIVLWSDDIGYYSPKISACAYGEIGLGGFLEMSAARLHKISTDINLSGANNTAGQLLLDPTFLTVQTAGGAAYSAGVNNLFTNNIGGTNIITPASIVSAAVSANITLQANTDVTFNDALSITTSGRTLTVQAGRSILINSAISTTNGSISLSANDTAATSADRAIGAGNITMSGSTISSGTAGLTMTIGTSNSAPFTPGNITALGLTGGAISLSTPNSLTASTIGCSSLSVSVGANSTISGVISGTGATLTKIGSGLLNLTAANTYTGATTVSAGTLQLSNALSAGTTAGGLSVTSGATAEINGVSIGTEALTINGTGVDGNGALIGTGTCSLSGNITLGSNTTIGGAGTMTLSGVISGAFNLTKTGNGTISLSGANTYSGTTTVSAGTLRASNATGLGAVASTITVANGATLDINAVTVGAKPISLQGSGVSGIGALTGTGTAAYGGTIALAADTTIGGTGTLTLSGILSGAFNLTKNGSGSVLLSGANTYSGTTTVSVGTLRAGNATALGSIATAVSIADGATLDINAVSVGAKPISLQGSGVGGIGALTGTGTSSYSGAITMLADTTIGGTGTFTISGVISGAFNLTKVGTSIISLSGANTYSGSTLVSAGTLRASNAASLGSNATIITVSSGATLDINSVAIGAKPLSISGTGVSSSGALTATGTCSYAGSITMSSNTTFGGAGTATVSGSIGGGFNLTKTGASTYIFSNANTYTGSTIINAGSIRISNDNQLGAVPGSFSSSNIILAGGTLNSTSALTINANRGILLNANSTIQSDVTSLTYNGVISGTGFGFTKTGPGNFSLGGTNTFTGPVTISAGILTFTQSNSIANCSALTLANTAGVSLQLNSTNQTVGSLSGGGTTGGNIVLGANTLSINQTAATSYAGTITGAGNISLTTNSNNTLSLTSINSTYTGTTSINGGSLLIVDDRNIGSAPSTVTPGQLVFANNGSLIANATLTLNKNRGILLNSGGGNIQVNSGFTLTYGGVIDGANQITKSGLGIFSSSGVHTYTGITNINSGTFLLTVANGIANSSSVILANVNDAILDCNSFNQTINNLTGGGISGGKIVLGSANIVINETSNTSFDGELSGTGNLTLSPASNSTLTLTNSSSGFTGAINLSGGILAISSDINLGAIPVSATANKITFNGGTLNITANMSISANRGINLSGTGAILINSGITGTYDGIITGAGTLNKTGIGTLELGGANTYTGATEISNGTLRLTSASSLGSTSGTNIQNGSTLDLNFNSSTLGNNNNIYINGSGVGGIGSIYLSGSNITINNPINVTGNSLISGNGSGTINFGSTITSASTLDIILNNASIVLPTINQSNNDININAFSSINQNGPLSLVSSNLKLAGTSFPTDINLNSANDFGGNTISFIGTQANIRDVYMRDVGIGANIPNFVGLTNLRNLGIEFNNSAISLPSITLTNSGSLTLIAGGSISQLGAFNIPGSSIFTTGNYPISLNSNNQLVGTVSFTNTGSNDVTLNNYTDLILATSSIGRNFTTTNDGSISQVGTLTIPGTANFSSGSNFIALNLNNAINGAISLNSTGANDVSIKNTLPFIIGTINVSQDLSIVSGGSINQNGPIIANGGITSLSSTVANSDINLNLANDFNGHQIVFSGNKSNIRDVSLRSISSDTVTPSFNNMNNLRNLTLQFDSAGVIFSQTTLHNAGNLVVNASGPITQTASIVVPGTTILTAGTNAINLTQNNILTGAITLSNSGNNDISVTNTTATVLANSTIGRNLTITTTGEITQTGPLIVPGKSKFASGSFPITLTDDNLLTGDLSFSNSGSNDVSIKNTLATVLNNINIGSSLIIDSGSNITESGAITMTGGSLIMSVQNPLSSILLDADNNFGSYAPQIAGNGANLVNLNIRNSSTNAALPVFTNLTNLHYLELSFPNGNIPLTNLNMNGTAVFTANNVTGDLNVHGLQLDSNFCNLNGFVNGSSGQDAIDQIVLLNTISEGTHFFDGIDMYGSTPPTPPTPGPTNSDIPQLVQVDIANSITTTNDYWNSEQTNNIIYSYQNVIDSLKVDNNDNSYTMCNNYGNEIIVCN